MNDNEAIAWCLTIAGKEGVLPLERFRAITEMVQDRLGTEADIPLRVAWAINGEADADMSYARWKDDNYLRFSPVEEIADWVYCVIVDEIASGRTDWTTSPATRREKGKP